MRRKKYDIVQITVQQVLKKKAQCVRVLGPELGYQL
jgi:hypothetical protein